MADYAKLILCTIVVGASMWALRQLRKNAAENEKTKQEAARDILNGILRDAVKCQATRILFGVPDNDKPRIQIAKEVVPADVQAKLDELDECVAKASLPLLKQEGKKYDSVLADCKNDQERVQRLTQVPIVSLADGSEMPVWLESDEDWRLNHSLPFVCYGPFLEALSHAFTAIPNRKDSLLPEYIEIPWDDKQKLYVRCRIRVEPDYHFSIEIIDWTGAA